VMAAVVAASTALAQDTSCCTIVALDAKRQLVTAVERASGKLFRLGVKDAAVFKTARLCESFDGPLAEARKDASFAADFGKADPKKPCCTLATEVGGAGTVLGVRPWEIAGVSVILTELRRTSGDTLTARWQYCNGTTQTVKFKPEGCVGMGCTYTPAYGMYLLDGATRQKHPMLKDDRGYLVADLYPGGNLAVGPYQIFTTWAKFNAPPASSTAMTVVIPGTKDQFEDVPIQP